MTQKSSFMFFALVFSLSVGTVFAGQDPKALGTDSRIRHVLFNPNEVYGVKATYGFQTTIEFSESETIQVASIGDSIAWQVVPVRNKLFLKPVEQNPKTNLTVVTNKRTYYFNLTTLSIPASSDMTYLVRFEYPGTPPQYADKFFEAKSPAHYNFDYKIKGGRKSGFLRAFDNGEFTYIQFKDLSDLPAIFLIDENKESVVNYRIEGAYVVIERIGEEFLFRRGKKVGKLINNNFKNSSREEETPSNPNVSQVLSLEVSRG